MSRKLCGALLVVGLMVSTPACDVLTALLQSRLVTVSLVNNADFPVEGTLVYGDDQDTLDFLLGETGTTVDFSVAAGQTFSFTRGCDDLQAILIEDADLRVIGGIGPEANTDLLRDGDDFGCGDTIVFTFDHSDLIVDFDINVSVRASASGL